jgi:hypothetical protein
MPRFGQGPEAKLTQARKRLDEKRTALERSRTILEHIDADLDGVAARAASGELDDDAATRALAEIADVERRHTAEVDHLERSVALIEAEIVDLTRDDQLTTFHAAAEQHGAAETTKLASADEIAKKVKSLVAATARHEQLRQAAAAAAAAAGELHPDGPSAADLPVRDEAAWPDAGEIERLRAFLDAGALRPAANAAASAERAVEDRERQDNEEIRACVIGLPGLLRPDMIAAEIARLPTRLQARAWEQAGEMNDRARKVSEKRDAQELARQPQRVLR